MPSYNGLLSGSFIKGSSTGGEYAVMTGSSTSVIADAVPMKYFNSALFGVEAAGISGGFAAFVISRIGGATFVIAGRTGITANGSFLMGSSSAIVGVPRPAYVEWQSAVNLSGVTAHVYMAGEY